MNTINEKFDYSRLGSLFSYAITDKIQVEFTSDEINDFNRFVEENNINQIMKFLNFKKEMLNGVLEDIINFKTDSLLEFIAKDCYDVWKDTSRDEFLYQLSDYEKIAVQFRDFNYQIENGGLSKWHSNGYSEDLGDMYKFLTKSNFEENLRDKFLDILDEVRYIKKAIDELDESDDFYSEDYDTRISCLVRHEEEYHDIKKEWIEYFNNFLVKNVSKKYIDKLYNVDTLEVKDENDINIRSVTI